MRTLLVLAMLTGNAANAQSTFGSIVGSVRDTSDAVIPAAPLTLTNRDTNERHTTSSGRDGLFQFINLAPGPYRLEVEQAGFGRYVREPLVVEVQKTIRIDVALTVGQTSERIQVVAETPLLEPENSSLGQVVERRKVEELPLNGRNPLALVALVPGVVPGGGSLAGPALPNFYAWGNFQISGALGNQSETMLDGTTVHGMLMNTVRLVPIEDAVQEFKVQTNSLAAEFGHTSGGIINLTTKSGTNRYHGSAFEFVRNDVFDASTFFNNSKGIARPPLTQNQFGATFGGPVIKDRLFFFTSYESYRQRKGQSVLFTVPTAEQRNGDFSQTRTAAGAVIPVYDATTTRLDAATNANIRDAFPGNVIPRSRIDGAAGKLSNLLMSSPNVAGSAFTNINNFATNASQAANSDQFNARVDFNRSSSHRLFGRYTYWDSGTPAIDPYNNGTIYQLYPDFRTTHQGVLESVHTFSPTTVLDVRYSFIKFDYERIPKTKGIDLTTLGFPTSMQQQIPDGFRHLPNFSIQGFNTLPGGGPIRQNETTNQVSANLTKIAGRHTVKFGTDLRVYRLGYTQSNEPSGAFNFTAPFTARDPFGAGGYAYASFLLGYAATAALNTPAYLNEQRIYQGYYVQDDYRVNRRLTLNLGLRWDRDGGITERDDRLSTFQADQPHPFAQQTGLPLVGRLALVNSQERSTRHWADQYNKQFAPRAGFAFSITPKTVLRGGYGLFWLPLAIARRENLVEATATGSSPFLGSIDGGRTPYRVLSNPFPDGITQPVGRDANFQRTLTGQVIPTTVSFEERAYSQQWNMNLQRDLSGSSLIEVAYVGLKANKLPINVFPFNTLRPEVMQMGSALTGQVANPFFGQVSRGVLSTATVARGQLLRPFPQYDNVTVRGSFIGNSIYHSMQLKYQKRFQTGAGVLVSYTASKLITDTESQTSWLEPTAGVQNPYNMRLERGLSSSDIPQRLVISGNYDLPFGRGKTFLSNASGVAGKLVSGWVMNGIFTTQRGVPLFLTTAANQTGSLGGGSRPNSTGQSAMLEGPAQQRLNRWFDTSRFTAPAAFTYGNVARTLPDVRGPGLNNVDFSIFKNTAFGPEQRFNLQFRAESYNLFNRTEFSLPGTAFGTAQFGVISSQANDARLIQFALKLSF
ncbi:MAG: carboxypeptidase regulatory-like domain-containing protein [Bryobacteraceae bacterium]